MLIDNSRSALSKCLFVALLLGNRQGCSKRRKAGACYAVSMPNRTEPKTFGEWVRYVVFAAIALWLVWWMLRFY